MPFSNDFLWGASTAAHQVEGNNTHSDYWIQEHVKHSDFVEPSGMAVDHYNRYKEDIQLLKDAGCNAYRFSIEWARIEPEEGKYDSEETRHYRKVLEFCHSVGITPVVTLHHFSSPAWLISKGGWCKPYAAEAFGRYCEYIAQNLGELMNYVCTINEANMGFQLHKVIDDMMKAGKKKEGAVQVGTNDGLDLKKILLGMLEQGWAFRCNPFGINTFLKPRNLRQEEIVMQAHRAGVQAFRKYCPDVKTGLTLSLFDYQPTEDGAEMAAKLWQEDFGWYLPYIKDDDFLGVQNYSRKVVDSKGAREPAAVMPLTQMGYEDYPQAIGHVLRKVAREFPGELLVTENGIGTDDDERRCAFIREAVAGVKAAKNDGVNVIGYLHWSLLDNFEWQAGYAKTFGLIAVDRKTQKRYPKESLKVLGELAKQEVC